VKPELIIPRSASAISTSPLHQRADLVEKHRGRVLLNHAQQRRRAYPRDEEWPARDAHQHLDEPRLS
jgi:hypothetical protein